MSDARISASLTRFTHKLVYLSVSLIGFSRTVQALVDSGATLNFIHEALVANLGLITQSCPPIKVRLADGRILAHTNRKVSLKFTIAGVPHTQTFYVAPIGMHSMILGMPWLESVNPVIDWRRKTILSYFVHNTPVLTPVLTPALTSSLATSSELVLSHAKAPADTSPRTEISLANTHPANSKSRPRRSSQSTQKNRRHRPKARKPRSLQDYEPKLPKSPPKVRLTRRINSNDEVYLLHLDEIHSLPEFLCTLEITDPVIPDEYRDLAEVFSKAKSEELPPHRGSLDHAIPLEKDSKPVFGPIYNLSETELQVLREYIDEKLRNGFIRPSTSPFGSPVLFVKKPDGSLRLCVDYRALNRITIKNRYPLPLISELLDRFKGAKYFTRLDVREAFNRLRIALGDEYKTAFRTRYGHFEYLVMPFGLCNAPGSFQAYVNDVIREYLDKFAVAYLDDILIYSNTLEEHILHVRQVLKKLLEHGLFVKLEKCEFHVQKISFLGFVISPEGISMDPAHISTISDWPVPRSVTDIQIFLGFANFYRRFIDGYSRVVLPITSLLRTKGSPPFEWTSAAQDAFERLKVLFTSAPILRHFDPGLPVTLHSDSSGFAISGIISQPHDGLLHPVAYWSRKCTPAECNYDIHDREMLAIVECMKHWRHYLEGSKYPIHVRSDHKNLERFMTTKLLNRRQARWAEILSGYDFVLDHITGTKNPADGPSRRPDYAEDVELPSGALIPQSALRLLPPGAGPAPGNSPSIASAEASLSSSGTRRLASNTPVFANLAVFTVESSLRQRILDALSVDPLADEQRRISATATATANSPWSWENGLLLYKNLIYVPQDDAIRLELLQQHHDSPLAGHFGIAKTHELLSRNYYFPGMLSFVKSYVSTCDLCSRGKAPRHAKHGELSPLPVPSGPWKSVSCDFITDLPPSNGFDSVLVFVDRFTKMSHFTPCLKSTDAPEFASMFLKHVIRLHGIPDSVVSDRGSIFTSHFWKSLSALMNMKQRLSTAFHPQTDGQTERMNQTLEQYLRIYCNYEQDDWANLLSLAEFAYNNSHQPSIDCSPFYANYGYNPEFTLNLRSPISAPAAKSLADSLHSVHERLVENVKSAQDHQARYHNAKHKPVKFNVGDKVWLLSTNIRTVRPSKKLDWKRLGPFSITKCIGTQAYQLALPNSIRIHNVFHVSLLEPYSASAIPGRTPPPPPPVIIDSEQEFEVEQILDSKFIRKRLHYLVQWKGYSISENSWEPDHLLRNSPDLVKSFHSRYPSKPRPHARR